MKNAILALITLLPALAFADVKADFVKIEADQTACLNQPDANSQVGMEDCAEKAYLAADKELNQIYAQTVAGLKQVSGDKFMDDNNAEVLRRYIKAERAWIAFRDAQVDSDGASMLGGSGEGLLEIQSMYDMTKARAIALGQ